MIEFKKFELDNGLKILVHLDKTTPLAAFNLAYSVGARDEDPEKTGFAHLFEHLMFGGSVNVPDYDTEIQSVGGENNAFTSSDLTNYYITLPADNLETAFWLESDRMLSLCFNERSLEVQRNVVIEEFKQRNMNQPYGDVYELLKDLSYKKHPYRWQVIGKKLAHIEQATMEDVKDFFFKFYAPNNAVLTVSGNVDADQVLHLAQKWFGDIPRRNTLERDLPKEPVQKSERRLVVERDVPSNALYMSFHMDKKFGTNYFASNLISDLLSNGDSSRMYKKLILEQSLFSELDAYIGDDHDPGVFIVAAKLSDQVSYETAEVAIWNELNSLKNKLVESEELEKVVNKLEANLIFSEISYLNKAINLSEMELLGDANLINEQFQHYREVTPEKINEVSKQLFQKANCSTLIYKKKAK